MDGVALAAVITSGVIGLAGVGSGVWTTRINVRLARENRKAEAYLELLRFVEEEGLWISSRANYMALHEDIEMMPEFPPPRVAPRPELSRRALMAAIVGVYPSKTVRRCYATWTKEADACADDIDWLDGDWESRNPGPVTAYDPKGMKRLREEREPAEKAAREALADAVATELSSK